MHEGPHHEVRIRWQLCFVTIKVTSTSKFYILMNVHPVMIHIK